MDRTHKLTRRALIGITSSVLLLASGCSSVSQPDESLLTYPALKYATYSTDGERLIDSYNVVRTAINQNHWLPVTETSEFNSHLRSLFPELEKTSALNYSDLGSESFHLALKSLVQSFSCELYSSQQSKDSVQACPPSNTMAANGLDYLPFHQGLRFEQRLSVQALNKNEDLQLELFLKSGSERSLESLWGAVHTLGQFSTSVLSPNNLVLTVNVTAHKKSDANAKWQAMHQEPLIFFVALPTIDEFMAQSNEVAAMQYSYNNAKILLVDSR